MFRKRGISERNARDEKYLRVGNDTILSIVNSVNIYIYIYCYFN